jgi:hypothetical protein
MKMMHQLLILEKVVDMEDQNIESSLAFPKEP